mmetsp:Transcript_21391/g.34243  ORF Transcript_21391/g.34243 Transcript_21391/m.34243 type:complete len:488 (+) Transcript_21391:166-1629(+)
MQKVNFSGNGKSNNEQQNYKANNNNNNNNNDDIHGFGSLGAAPLALGASQDHAMWKGSHYAPTMVDSDIHGLSGVSGPQQMGMVKQTQTAVRQQAMIISQGGMDSLDDTPLSFGAMKPQIQVLPSLNDNGMTETFDEFKSEVPFFVPSKCIGLNGGGLQATPAMYNELTSIVVDETPQQVLEKFSAILSTFSNDIDFSVDAANYIISGQIFVRHFAVFFKISIWEESGNGDRTRFECRRCKGDTMGFTEFWNEIEEILYAQFTNPKGAKNDLEDTDNDANDSMGDDDGGFAFGALPPLDYSFNLDALDVEMNNDEQTAFSKDDLDNFVQDMHDCDPSVVYSIAMLLDAFTVQTQFLQMVLDHTQFVKTVIDIALKHQDTALVRGALIMLEKLCDSKGGADSLMAFRVLDGVTPLLQHDCDLIRKYAIRVLSKLSSAQSWSFNNEKLRRLATVKVSECKSKWAQSNFASNDFIQPQMFENIHQKLIKV